MQKVSESRVEVFWKRKRKTGKEMGWVILWYTRLPVVRLQSGKVLGPIRKDSVNCAKL